MWKYKGRWIKEGRAWVDDNGIRHPWNWAIWSDEYKREIGLVWEDKR